MKWPLNGRFLEIWNNRRFSLARTGLVRRNVNGRFVRLAPIDAPRLLTVGTLRLCTGMWCGSPEGPLLLSECRNRIDPTRNSSLSSTPLRSRLRPHGWVNSLLESQRTIKYSGITTLIASRQFILKWVLFYWISPGPFSTKYYSGPNFNRLHLPLN